MKWRIFKTTVISVWYYIHVKKRIFKTVVYNMTLYTCEKSIGKQQSWVWYIYMKMGSVKVSLHCKN